MEWDAPDPATSKAPIEFTTLVTMNRLNYSISLKYSKSFRANSSKEFLSIQPGDVPATYANVEALEKDVDFRPNTPIEEGIESLLLGTEITTKYQFPKS